MAKRIGLLRHAKSSWDNPGQDDFDRPLNKRGLRDAPQTGARLLQSKVKPSLIISSDAKRAFTTAQLVAAELGLAPDRIVTDHALYLASASAVLEVLYRQGEDHDYVMLVGHNPGITNLANRLSDARIDNLPTCGYFQVHAAISDWRKLTSVRGELELFDYPKKDRDTRESG